MVTKRTCCPFAIPGFVLLAPTISLRRMIVLPPSGLEALYPFWISRKFAVLVYRPLPFEMLVFMLPRPSLAVSHRKEMPYPVRTCSSAPKA